ncbi:tRNA intron endonuclease [Globomyces pollinis-pini]|nr:tRNA intron endonuclease [Globomyces pollinis-pini]
MYKKPLPKSSTHSFPFFLPINFKNQGSLFKKIWTYLCFYWRYIRNKFYRKKLIANINRHIVVEMNPDILYRNGAFGKGQLSRGEPTWQLRHFHGLTQSDGLADQRKITDFQTCTNYDDWRNVFSSEKDEQYILKPEEAFFLSYALNCLDVYQDGKMLSFAQQWSYYRNLSREVPKQEFAVRYAVYHYYRSKGWVVRSGILFGTDYVLYKKGPEYRHSDYAVFIVTKDIPLKSIIGKSRCCLQSKKNLLLCYVSVPPSIDTYDCLQQIKVWDVVVSRYLPQQ